MASFLAIDEKLKSTDPCILQFHSCLLGDVWIGAHQCLMILPVSAIIRHYSHK